MRVKGEREGGMEGEKREKREKREARSEKREESVRQGLTYVS